MKTPPLKRSKVFYLDSKIPCWKAKFKCSELSLLGRQHIQEFEEDPLVELYIVSASANSVNAWTQKWLEHIFVENKLSEIVENAMREFESSKKWCGYDKADDEAYNELMKHGIVAYLYPQVIVFEERTKEVLVGMAIAKDMNLSEHGVTVYLKGDRWRFGYSDRLTSFLHRLDEEFGCD